MQLHSRVVWRSVADRKNIFALTSYVVWRSDQHAVRRGGVTAVMRWGGVE